MRSIKTVDAVGAVLCHDITQIIPGEKKGRIFQKGHIIREEDIPVLLSVGKDHVFVWETEEGVLHENEAADRLKNLACGEYITYGEVKEGKIELFAEANGLLQVDQDLLLQLNSLGEMILSTLPNKYMVKAGQKLGGTKVIPLVIGEDKMQQIEKIIGEKKILSILPYKPKKVGIVTTGNEVYHGRIQDAFGPALQKKLQEFDCQILGQTILPDDAEEIRKAIELWIAQGAEMVLCTGGMSVDPDDVTPTAIRRTGAKIVTYGAPVLPGAMFLLAYQGEIPILGLPGCVMYAKRTIFDLVFPRILTGEMLRFEDIAAYGPGGLCLDCEVCRFPNCTFGSGI